MRPPHRTVSLIHNIYKWMRNKSYGRIYTDRINYVIGNIVKNENILILGARSNFIFQIIQNTGKTLEYHVVDKIKPNLENQDIVYHNADLNGTMPFPDNYFDCIVTDQLIEHLFKPDILIKEMRRVSKKNGRVIIGSENLASWHNIFAMILGMHPFSDHYSEYIRIGNPLSIHNKKELKNPYSRHCKVPTIRALKELLEYYGYRILEKRGFGHMIPLGVRFDVYHSIQFVIVAEVPKP